MTAAQRIIVNTTAQYTRTIINVCLSLYSTRLILAALGQNDFGIYSVVAGVVAMLAFVTNALVTTTQRFLSFNYGKGNMQYVSRIFSNSLLLHLLIGAGVLVVLGALGYPIVHSVLNIEDGRESAALYVYLAAVLMLTLTFITAPYRALFIARENIVYISIIDVLDGTLRLLIAVFLTYISSFDRLVTYSMLLVGISVFNLLAFALYAMKNFPECRHPHWSDWDRGILKELSGFAGWTVYSSGCVIVRNQGIAVLINIFCSTIANAAYGIAQQVSGAVAFISASIINAINPQIMSAEGQGNRKHMIQLAEYESKYAFLLLSVISLPLIFEMDSILQLWLGEVPMYTVSFCQLMLLAAVFDQLTIGLTSANQAIGKIKVYTLWFYSFKLITILGIWLCLQSGVPVAASLWCYVIIELLGSVMRMILMKHQADIAIYPFVKHVCYRVIMPFVSMSLTSYLCSRYLDISYRFLFTLVMTVLVGGVMIWLTSLDSSEKQYIHDFIHRNRK